MGTHPRFGVTRYFERGRYVGERQVYFAPAASGGESFSGYWPHIGYLCPECGELWLREIQEHPAGYSSRITAKWVCRPLLCPSHGSGCILDNFPLEFCSPELLLREATLILLKGLI